MNLLILLKFKNALKILILKLVKLSAAILSTPLSITINNSFKYGVFPDDAKIISVIPFDKGKADEHEIFSSRLESILNSFLKYMKSYSRSISFRVR